MVFFLLQQALRNEHGHIDILVTGRLEHAVENMLDIFPNGVAVGSNNHTAANAAVIDQLRLFDHIGVPLGKIVLH